MRASSALLLSVLLAALLACKKEDSASPRASATATATATAPAPAASATTPPGAVDTEQGKTAPDDSPVPAIPDERSSPPTVAEWNAAEEINTQDKNSQPDKCEQKVVREWVRVTCRGEIVSYEKMVNFGVKNSDYFEMVTPGRMASFVVRLKKGKTQSVRICRKDDRASLFINWPAKSDRPVHIALGKGPKCGA